MKTILHVIDTTGPGGAETVFIELADRLRTHGYRSEVVVRGSGWVLDQLRARGLQPVVLDAQGAFNWRYLRGLTRLIRERRVDIVQSHLLGSNVYCAAAGLLTRRPTIATFHGMVDVAPQERWRWAKFQLMNAGVSDFVAVSGRLRDAIRAEGLLDPTKASVIYNGVDMQRYALSSRRDLRASLGLPDDALLIGSLGNVRPAKAYDVLIRAARNIIDRHPQAHFVIAGHVKASLMRELEPLMAELDVAGHVHFLGFRDDSADFLAQLDLFLLSSTSEGFSIATIEAMATGLPVVVTRCGGPEEIVTDGVTGLMVPPGNSGALADGVLALQADVARRTALAAAGRTHAQEQFSMERMLEGYMALYRRLA